MPRGRVESNRGMHGDVPIGLPFTTAHHLLFMAPLLRWGLLDLWFLSELHADHQQPVRGIPSPIVKRGWPNTDRQPLGAPLSLQESNVDNNQNTR